MPSHKSPKKTPAQRAQDAKIAASKAKRALLQAKRAARVPKRDEAMFAIP